MKYILLQNTSYTRRPVFLVRTLEEFNEIARYKDSHIKPILISTDCKILGKAKRNLMETYTK